MKEGFIHFDRAVAVNCPQMAIDIVRHYGIQPDWTKFSPITLYRESEQILDTIFSLGYDINHKQGIVPGDTLLHCAVRDGNVAKVLFLLNRGAKTTLVWDGYIPLDICRTRWLFDRTAQRLISKLLIDRGSPCTKYVEFYSQYTARRACRATICVILRCRPAGRDCTFIVARMIWLTRGDELIWNGKRNKK